MKKVNKEMDISKEKAMVRETIQAVRDKLHQNGFQYEPKEEKKITKYIEITADTNDGDYVTERNKITDEKIELIKQILPILKEHHGNWPTGQCGIAHDIYTKEELSSEQINMLNEYVPDGEYGVHTIEDIVILHVVEEEKLF